jgi:hypothetical protein
MKTHLKITEMGTNRKIKTKLYIVRSNWDDSTLGTIRWERGWRQYVFYPFEDRIWSWDCLKELSEFIKNLMDERKRKKAEG